MNNPTQTISALFVDSQGPYSNRENIDPWPESRDARLYNGPNRVIAHPPCSRWCRLAGLVEARWGYKRGEDGGCFESALNSVRKWGGVLEHPAYSSAWKAFGLSRPDRNGGWKENPCGGYTAHVEQGRYGHRAKKATWLYVYGLSRDELPELKWGSNPDGKSEASVSWCGNHTKSFDKRPRLGLKERSATPPEFLEVLVKIAAKCLPDSES